MTIIKRGVESGIYYGYFVAGAAFLSMVVIWASFYAFGIFLKPVLSEFHWSRANFYFRRHVCLNLGNGRPMNFLMFLMESETK